MAGSSTHLPEPRRVYDAPVDFEYYLDEFAAGSAGAMSPFGQDVEFPLPPERLNYHHPGPADRPNLAGD